MCLLGTLRLNHRLRELDICGNPLHAHAEQCGSMAQEREQCGDDDIGLSMSATSYLPPHVQAALQEALPHAAIRYHRTLELQGRHCYPAIHLPGSHTAARMPSVASRWVPYVPEPCHAARHAEPAPHVVEEGQTYSVPLLAAS